MAHINTLGQGSRPHDVIIGLDGGPWITDGALNAIVRVDPVCKKDASDFKTMVIGNSPSPNLFSGSPTGKTVVLYAGAYKVDENISSGYIPHYSTDCNSTRYR